MPHELSLPPVTIETLRLRLRLPQGSDAGPLAEIHSDPEISPYVLGGVPPVVGLEVAWRNIAMLVGHWHIRGFGPWVVEDRLNREVVGRVGFWAPDGWPGIELTWLIRRSHWNSGLATEAASAALTWADRTLSTKRIISLIHPDNVRSIRVATKIGEQLEGDVVLAETRLLVFGVALPLDPVRPVSQLRTAWLRSAERRSSDVGGPDR
jgi:RimJ/RimL family protein N-acetyltransferase